MASFSLTSNAAEEIFYTISNEKLFFFPNCLRSRRRCRRPSYMSDHLNIDEQKCNCGLEILLGIRGPSGAGMFDNLASDENVKLLIRNRNNFLR